MSTTQSKLTLNIEISSTDSKSGNTETHEMLANTEEEMAQKIVALWLDRCKIQWNEIERASLQDFVDGHKAKWRPSAADRTIDAAYNEALGADQVLAIVCNYSTLDQALVNSDDAEQQDFVIAAEQYASRWGHRFEIIRDIQKPAFFLSIDGETMAEGTEDEANKIFEAICEKVTA